jgi:hypothetical protein
MSAKIKDSTSRKELMQKKLTDASKKREEKTPKKPKATPKLAFQPTPALVTAAINDDTFMRKFLSEIRTGKYDSRGGFDVFCQKVRAQIGDKPIRGLEIRSTFKPKQVQLISIKEASNLAAEAKEARKAIQKEKRKKGKGAAKPRTKMTVEQIERKNQTIKYCMQFWDTLTYDDKRLYYYEDLIRRRKTSYNVRNFLIEFKEFSADQQDMFIDSYLKGSANFTTAFAQFIAVNRPTEKKEQPIVPVIFEQDQSVRDILNVLTKNLNTYLDDNKIHVQRDIEKDLGSGQKEIVPAPFQTLLDRALFSLHKDKSERQNAQIAIMEKVVGELKIEIDEYLNKDIKKYGNDAKNPYSMTGSELAKYIVKHRHKREVTRIPKKYLGERHTGIPVSDFTSEQLEAINKFVREKPGATEMDLEGRGKVALRNIEITTPPHSPFGETKTPPKLSPKTRQSRVKDVKRILKMTETDLLKLSPKSRQRAEEIRATINRDASSFSPKTRTKRAEIVKKRLKDAMLTFPSKTGEKRVEDIRNFLRRTVDSLTQSVCASLLSQCLLKIAKIPDYEDDSFYIQSAVRAASVVNAASLRSHQERLFNGTNGGLIHAVLKFIIAINFPLSVSLRTKMLIPYYSPSFLLLLQFEELIPEVFNGNVSKAEKDVLLISLLNRIDKCSDKLAEIFVNAGINNASIGHRIELDDLVGEYQYSQPNIDFKKCQDEPNHIVVFEDGVFYCLDGEQLSDQFNDTNRSSATRFLNPQSAKRFSDNFINMYFYEKNDKYYFRPSLYVRFSQGNKIDPYDNKQEFSQELVDQIIREYELPKFYIDDVKNEEIKCENNTNGLKSLYYWEDKKLYCLPIEDLLQQLKSYEDLSRPITNIYTNNLLSDEFVRYLKTHKHKLVTKGEFPKLLITNLWEIARKDLDSRLGIVRGAKNPKPEEPEKKVTKEEPEEEVEEVVFDFEEKEPEKKVTKEESEEVVVLNFEEEEPEEEVEELVLNFEEEEPEKKVTKEESEEELVLNFEEEEPEKKVTKEKPEEELVLNFEEEESEKKVTKEKPEEELVLNFEEEEPEKKVTKEKPEEELVLNLEEEEDANMKFGSSDKCKKCNADKSAFKSIALENGEYVVYSFCSPACMEKFDFPKSV